MTSIKYILFPLLAVFIAQFIKFIYNYIKTKKLDIMIFINGMGGMPSSHSALVSSLTTLIYLNYGLSIYFSISFIFSLIVIYDARCIRYESGNQAKVLNSIANTNLRESLGHNSLEVLVGIILGSLLVVILN